MYYIAVFGSRAATIRFAELLARNRIPASIISTPREASLGCGVSVKFHPDDYETVLMLYNRQQNFKQVHFYKVRKNGNGFLVSGI